VVHTKRVQCRVYILSLDHDDCGGGVQELDSRTPQEVTRRMPLLPTHVSMSDEVASPVAPSTFAVNRAFLKGDRYAPPADVIICLL
jgi:hypothetical protein